MTNTQFILVLLASIALYRYFWLQHKAYSRRVTGDENTLVNALMRRNSELSKDKQWS